MKRHMRTRVHRYAPRMPTIRENNEANMNNYVNYANEFEAEHDENNYANNFHPETEAEAYAAEKQIMAAPQVAELLGVDPLAPIPNGRVTPAPFRPVAAAAAGGAGPAGPPASGSFKPSIGSAFGAFKKGGRRTKNLKSRRRK